MALIRIIGPDGAPLAEYEASPVVSMLNVLLASGGHIRHDCGGKAICGTCAVRILGGREGLSPIEAREAERLSKRGYPEDYRLACQTKVSRDVVIGIPAQE